MPFKQAASLCGLHPDAKLEPLLASFSKVLAANRAFHRIKSPTDSRDLRGDPLFKLEIVRPGDARSLSRRVAVAVELHDYPTLNRSVWCVGFLVEKRALRIQVADLPLELGCVDPGFFFDRGGNTAAAVDARKAPSCERLAIQGRFFRFKLPASGVAISPQSTIRLPAPDQEAEAWIPLLTDRLKLTVTFCDGKESVLIVLGSAEFKVSRDAHKCREEAQKLARQRRSQLFEGPWAFFPMCAERDNTVSAQTSLDGFSSAAFACKRFACFRRVGGNSRDLTSGQMIEGSSFVIAPADEASGANRKCVPCDELAEFSQKAANSLRVCGDQERAARETLKNAPAAGT